MFAVEAAFRGAGILAANFKVINRSAAVRRRDAFPQPGGCRWDALRGWERFPGSGALNELNS